MLLWHPNASVAASAAGSLAFLLHTGHISGWRQYGSLAGAAQYSTAAQLSSAHEVHVAHLHVNPGALLCPCCAAELPPRLLAPEARRLPVVLHSVAQHGEALAVRAAHYPLLRRLADRYRGCASRRRRSFYLLCLVHYVCAPATVDARLLLPRHAGSRFRWRPTAPPATAGCSRATWRGRCNPPRQVGQVPALSSCMQPSLCCLLLAAEWGLQQHNSAPSQRRIA
jgi:hypothetical protein